MNGQQAFDSPISNPDMTPIIPVIFIMKKIYFKCKYLWYIWLWLFLLKKIKVAVCFSGEFYTQLEPNDTLKQKLCKNINFIS